MMSSNIRILCAATVTALCVAPAAAAVINVPGTASTIVAAAQMAQQGDTIEVANGVYDENRIFITTNSVTLNANGSTISLAAADNGADALLNLDPGVTGFVLNNAGLSRTQTNQGFWRTVQLNARAGATFNNCVFDHPAVAVGIIAFNASDVTLNNCAFLRWGGFDFGAAVLLEAFGDQGAPNFHDINMQNVTIAGGYVRALATIGGTRQRIGNVTMKNVNCLGQMGADGPVVRIQGTGTGLDYDPAANLLIEDCTFHGRLLEAMEIHYGGPSGIYPASFTMNRTTFKKYDGGRGVMFFDLACPSSFNNVVVEGGAHENIVRLGGALGPNSLTFNHCSMQTDGSPGTGESGGNVSEFFENYASDTTITLNNSIFYSPVRLSPAFDNGFGAPTTTSTRTFLCNNTILNQGDDSTAGDYVANAQLALVQGPDFSFANPQFTSAGTGNLTLTATSPAINRGATIPGIATDRNGAPRVQQGRPDMGAFETSFNRSSVAEWTLY